MTALDDIEAATAALNNLTAAEQAQAAAIGAQVSAALAAIVAPTRTVYLDAVAGLDTNDGTTAARAVATPGKAVGLFSAGQAGTVAMCSDVVLATPLSVPVTLTFISDWLLTKGYDDGTTRRKLTIAPSAMNAGSSEYFAIDQTWDAEMLSFYGVELHAGAITAGLSVLGLRAKLLLLSSTISFDPAFAVPLIQPFAASTIYFGSVTLPANYPGKIFNGVPAGGNLNSGTSLCRTNLLSA